MDTGNTATAPPEMPTVTLREATERQTVMLIRRWHDHYMGTGCDPGYLPGELAEHLGWNDDDAPPVETYPVLAEHRDVMVGCGWACAKRHAETVEEFPDGTFDADALAGDWNGWLMFGAVDPEWRGRGIGRDLFQARLRWLASEDVDMVFGYGWERDEKPSSRPLFERHGFVPVQTMPDYYSDRLSCPDCGVWQSDDRQCNCAATLWALDGDRLDEWAASHGRAYP